MRVAAEAWERVRQNSLRPLQSILQGARKVTTQALGINTMAATISKQGRKVKAAAAATAGAFLRVHPRKRLGTFLKDAVRMPSITARTTTRFARTGTMQFFPAISRQIRTGMAFLPHQQLALCTMSVVVEHLVTKHIAPTIKVRFMQHQQQRPDEPGRPHVGYARASTAIETALTRSRASAASLTTASINPSRLQPVVAPVDSAISGVPIAYSFARMLTFALLVCVIVVQLLLIRSWLQGHRRSRRPAMIDLDAHMEEDGDGAPLLPLPGLLRTSPIMISTSKPTCTPPTLTWTSPEAPFLDLSPSERTPPATPTVSPVGLKDPQRQEGAPGEIPSRHLCISPNGLPKSCCQVLLWHPRVHSADARRRQLPNVASMLSPIPFAASPQEVSTDIHRKLERARAHRSRASRLSTRLTYGDPIDHEICKTEELAFGAATIPKQTNADKQQKPPTNLDDLSV